MITKKLMLCCAIFIVAGPAFAQVELKAYADRDGYLDVQKLTCAQLANTFQEDTDYLAAWYSGLVQRPCQEARDAGRPRQVAAARSHRPLQGQSGQEGHRSD
jgi:hypothetical protein